jgi:hypothetical protein
MSDDGEDFDDFVSAAEALDSAVRRAAKWHGVSVPGLRATIHRMLEEGSEWSRRLDADGGEDAIDDLLEAAAFQIKAANDNTAPELNG